VRADDISDVETSSSVAGDFFGYLILLVNWLVPLVLTMKIIVGVEVIALIFNSFPTSKRHAKQTRRQVIHSV
jgi:hypothetical protein